MKQTLTAENTGLPRDKGMDFSMFKETQQTITPDMFKAQIIDSKNYIVLKSAQFKDFVGDVKASIAAKPDEEAAIIKAFNEDIQGIVVMNVEGEQYFVKAKVGVGMKKQQIATLRKQEQAELCKQIQNSEKYMGADGKMDRNLLTDKKDIAVFDKIYTKYDDLISPLMESKKDFDDLDGMSKSEQTDIEKAGPTGVGSKGGKVIGYTKSGKPIYDSHNHASHANFTFQDHKDAAKVNEKKMAEITTEVEKKYQTIHDKDSKGFPTKEAGERTTKQEEEFRNLGYQKHATASDAHKIYARNIKDKQAKSTDDNTKIKSDEQQSKEYSGLDKKQQQRYDSHIESNDISSGATKRDVHNMHEAAMKHATKSAKVKKAIETDLEKGALSDAFLYSDNLKFEKTGKEIKDQIDTLVAAEVAESIVLKAAAAAQAKLIEDDYDVKPSSDFSEYSFRGYKRKIAIDMKRFDWRELSYNSDSSEKLFSAPVGGSDVQSIKTCSSKEESEAKYKYNDMVEKYLESLVEIEVIKTIKGGLNDKEKYQLNQRQLTALNF